MNNEYSDNPYAAPVDAYVVDDPMVAAESIRRDHIRHEASIKSIGTLYFLGAIIAIPLGLWLMGMVIFMNPIARSRWFPNPIELAMPLGAGLLYFVIGAAQLTAAIGLRRLRPWARWTSVVLSALGLLAIPVGTLISGYFLYLLLSRKGEYIFSPPYQHVIAATPHIKYRTSPIVIVLVVLLAIVLIVGLIAAITSNL